MQKDHPNNRAIVIGAGMGGLLAARALADYYAGLKVRAPCAICRTPGRKMCEP
jgi:alpha-beta hydrolase superfamily lysophospholipase